MKDNYENKNNKLKEFREAVERHAREKEDFLFYSEGPERTLITLESLFRNANDIVRIATQQLTDDVVVGSDIYIDSVQEYLNRGETKLHIILAEKPNEIELREKQHPFYYMLYNHPAYNQGRVIAKVGICFKVEYEGEERIVNFCTGDSKMYCFESYIPTRQAISNFNDEETTKIMDTEFDRYFSRLGDKNRVDLKNIFENIT